MSIEKAKQILGDYGQDLSNEKIGAIIECFNALIEVGFQQLERMYEQEKEVEACNGATTV